MTATITIIVLFRGVRSKLRILVSKLWNNKRPDTVVEAIGWGRIENWILKNCIQPIARWIIEAGDRTDDRRDGQLKYCTIVCLVIMIVFTMDQLDNQVIIFAEFSGTRTEVRNLSTCINHSASKLFRFFMWFNLSQTLDTHRQGHWFKAKSGVDLMEPTKKSLRVTEAHQTRKHE